MAPVKVAAVQASSPAFNLDATLSKIQSLTQEASSHGAQLVVFPEAFVGCYPRHLGFSIGLRTTENREWYTRYVQAAIKVPDGAEGLPLDSSTTSADYAAFNTLAKIAKEASVVLSVGIIERSIVGATLWCTNLLFSPEGILLSRHRKLQPTAAERVVWSQGHARNEPTNPALPPTDNLPVADTSIGKIGGLICWEHLMPLARFALYKKGVEIWTAPTADSRPTWAPIMQTIAQEGRCFVVSANQYHTSEDFPGDYPANVARTTADSNAQDSEVWSRGGSCIVGPLGQILAGPLWDEEGIVYAEIDLDDRLGALLDFDPVGHYSRDNMLQLVVK